MENEIDKLKQKFSDIEKKISEIDLDKVASKKGSKLKDRYTDSELDLLKQRITSIESILDDIDESVMHKKGSKLKDR